MVRVDKSGFIIYIYVTMNDGNLFNSFNEGLKIMSVCPVCSKKYEPIQAKIVLEKDNSHLVHINCSNCFSSVLAVITSNNFGINSVGVVTDLQVEDVLRFIDAESVNSDDVIEMHKMLSKQETVINKFLYN